VERNIRLLPWFVVVKMANIYVPFLAPLLLALELDDAQVLLLIGVTYTVSGVTEIHTGYWADQFGRRLALMAGTGCAAVAFALYATLDGLGVQAFVAAVLAGLGSSLIMGTDNAMLYDSYRVLGREPEARHMFARLGGVGGFAEGAAALIGGFVLQPFIGYRGIMWVQVALFAVAFCVTLFLVETPRIRHRLGPWQVVRKSLSNRKLAPTLLFSAWGSNLSEILVWWTPLYFLYATDLAIGVGGEGWVYSLFWAAFLMSLWPFHFAFRLFDKRREESLWFLVLLSLGCYAILVFGHGLWAFSAIFLVYFVRANMLPLTEQLINEKTTDEERATVQSIRRAIMRVISGVLWPLSGWFASLWAGSVPAGIALAGGIVVAANALCLVWMRRAVAFVPPKPL
jgi:MFS family permease